MQKQSNKKKVVSNSSTFLVGDSGSRAPSNGVRGGGSPGSSVTQRVQEILELEGSRLEVVEAVPASETNDGEAVSSYSSQWVLRVEVVGAGVSGSVIVDPFHEVRVVATDSKASAHFQSFSYEFSVVPYPVDGISASGVYEVKVTTGLFNTIPVNTKRTFRNDGLTTRWLFTTQPLRASCDNCGEPVLTIFTRGPR